MIQNFHLVILILFSSFCSVTHAQLQMPLLISAEKNGFQLSEPHLKYSLDKKSLSVGPVTLSAETFKFGALQSAKVPTLLLKLPKLLGAQPAIEFNYGDRFEVLSYDPKSLSLISSLKSPEIAEAQSRGFDEQDFVIQPSESFLTFSDSKDFRICLTQKKEELFARYCTPHLTLQKKKPLVLTASKRESQYVLTNGKISALQGQVDPIPFKKFLFYAINQVGYSVDLQLLPIQARIEQAYRLENDQLELLTVADCPFPSDCHPFPFHPAIAESKSYRTTYVPARQNIEVFGKDQIGTFEQNLNIKKVPLKSEQVLIDDVQSGGTYQQVMEVVLYSPRQVHLSSENGEIREIESNNPAKIWRIKNEIPGTPHTVALKQQIQDRTYASELEVYRAFSNEFSARFALLASNRNSSLLATINYNHWFENFFAIRSRYTTLRWGLSIDQDSTLIPLKSSDGIAEYDLRDLSVGLKYRLNSGLMNRDASWGLTTAYRDLTYANFSIAMLGAGGFGTFPLPDSIDEMLNQFSFLRGPKWIDFELLYFPISTDSNFSLHPTYSLKSSCKISWKQNFFGELGFGIKSFDFENSSNNGAKLTASFATIGLGLRF